jgi:hypothetical protein
MAGINTVNYGQGTTLTATDKELYLNIEKEIKKYPSPRIELVKRLGSFSQEVRSHKIEWSRRDNRPVKALVAEGTSDSGTVITVDTPGVFNVDDLVETSSGEQLIVTGVIGGVQVQFRRWAGTTAEVIGGTTIKRIGGATAQGKDADNMVVHGYEDLYNYTSILEDVVDLSGTEHNALIRGKENSGQLIARKQMELAEVWQSQMVVGLRAKNDSFKTYTSGGLKFLIDTYASGNVVNFGGSATWSSTGDDGPMGKLDDALDKLSAKVFDKPTLYVGAKFMRKFKYLMSDLIRTDQSNDARGIGVVGTYLSHLYGKVKVVLIQERTGWMDDLVFLVDESDVGQKAMKGREWQTYPLARMGDSFRWQILSERTIKIGNPEAHAYMHNLGV